MPSNELVTLDIDTSSKEYTHTQNLSISEAIKAVSKDKFLPYRESYCNVIELDLFDSRTYLSGLDQPFDTEFRGIFEHIARELMDYVDNAYFVYTNSDKIFLFYKDTESRRFFRGCISDIISRVSQKATRLMMNYLTEQLGCKLFSGDKLTVLHEMISGGCFCVKVYTMPVSLQVSHVYRVYRALFSGALQNVLFQHFKGSDLFGKDTYERIDMLAKKGITLSMFEEKYLRGLVFYLAKSGDAESWEVKQAVYTDIVLKDVLAESYAEVKSRQLFFQQQAALKHTKKSEVTEPNAEAGAEIDAEPKTDVEVESKTEP